jgi:hypothetical protein
VLAGPTVASCPEKKSQTFPVMSFNYPVNQLQVDGFGFISENRGQVMLHSLRSLVQSHHDRTEDHILMIA